MVAYNGQRSQCTLDLIITRQQLSKVNVNELTLSTAAVSLSSTVSDLGLLIDGQLNMSDHVASVCRSCYFQLRQLRQIKGSLTSDAIKTLVHAFISSRLDYCNSLLVGVSDDVLRKLQLIQNAAARLVTGTRKFEHITPVLHVALASDSQAHYIQGRYARIQKPAWSGAIVSVGILPTCFNCLRSTTPTARCSGRFVRSSYQDFGR
jgi:hypothetical protein